MLSYLEAMLKIKSISFEITATWKFKCNLLQQNILFPPSPKFTKKHFLYIFNSVLSYYSRKPMKIEINDFCHLPCAVFEFCKNMY